MRTPFLYTFAVGAASLVSADSVDHLFRRAACNADNCLRAVRASSATVRGSTDCMSFMTTTYTPCAATTTTTSPAPTTTVSASTTVTSTTTVNDTFHTYTFITATRTITTTTTAGVKKRNLHQAAKRQQQTTCTTGSLTSSSRIPAYASLCDSPARYSSACSCVGVTASTRTLSPSSTSVVTLTPSSTSTVTITGTSTFIIYEALATITDTYTRYLTETKTTTAAAPTCTAKAYSQYYMCGCDDVCMVQPVCVATGESNAQCAARCAANPTCATYFGSPQGDCYLYYSCCPGGAVYNQDEGC